MRVGLMLMGGVALCACDALAPQLPTSTYEPDPEVEVGQFRFGTVHWKDLQTDCADDAWNDDEAVTVLIEGDQVTMWFDTMPELTGSLAEGSADVAGTMQFPGETGATVTCVVGGSVNVSDAGVAGEMQEQLSSTGDVNCTSRARYHVTFDE